MPNESSKQPGWRTLGPKILIALVLLAPSLWMLAKIPPLWKDIDAYFQVALPPGVMPLLHYGPGYSFPARIPLYAGYCFDCLRAGIPLPSWRFLREPILSDSGVLALIVLQHAALCATACSLIFSAAPSFVARLVLALLWAANPLFYTDAHTVGSEALSLILTLLLATLGFRIITQRDKTSPIHWLLFALVLSCAILTRQINSLLAALLPLGFALTALLRLATGRREKAAQDFRRMLLALALGLVCLCLTSMTLRGLCTVAGLPYRSRLGFSFVSRLNFLNRLPPPERAQFLDEIAAGNHDPQVLAILKLLRADLPPGVRFESGAFMEKAKAVLPPEIANSEEEFDRALNATTQAFLAPPRVPFLREAWSDFIDYQRVRLDRLVRDRFRATAFYFGHEKDMPGCANLITYRGTDEARIFRYIRSHRYLRPPPVLNYLALLFVWLASLALAAILNPRRLLALGPYAVALLGISLLLLFAHSLLSGLLQRYALPSFELTIASITIVIGLILSPKSESD